ncbi:hypothetical protein [Streptomyces sp. NPDC003015]
MSDGVGLAGDLVVAEIVDRAHEGLRAGLELPEFRPHRTTVAV